MALLELPHSNDCLVCGRGNPMGLQLSFHVDPGSGAVQTVWTPGDRLVGFEQIIHGGAIAAVADEAMVWAATWRGKRFCLCAELTVRYRKPVKAGTRLIVSARLESERSRLITVNAEILEDAGHDALASAKGKYVPLSPEEHDRFFQTMLPEAATSAAFEALHKGQR